MTWYGQMVNSIAAETGVAPADVRRVLQRFYVWSGAWLGHRGQMSIRGLGRFVLSRYEIPEDTNPRDRKNWSEEAIRISFRASPKWRLRVLGNEGGARAEQGKGW